MIELILIKAMLKHAEYKKNRKWIDAAFLKQQLPETNKLIECIDKLHSLKEDTDYSIDDLEAILYSVTPVKKGDEDAYSAMFQRIRSVELSEEVIQQAVESHREKAVASSIALLAISVSEGKEDFQTLKSTLEAIQTKEQGETNSRLVNKSLEALQENLYRAGGLNWRLKALNQILGPLRKGDFGFIFARPEVGKTTFLADQISFMASQAAGKVLHFNNEEEGQRVLLRYYQAFLGCTNKELFCDFRENERKFLEAGGERLEIYDDASIHKRDVEELCKEYQPQLIVIDSIDKIKGFQDDRDDLVYKAIYQWARELAKTYGPVIGVCHASVSAEGKRWLEMDDVAYAKTAKQGEADWILGIGKLNEEGYEYIRYLHCPKNKLLGGENTEPTLRHGHVAVGINPEISRYNDLE